LHELQVTERILDIVLDHARRGGATKVVRVHLTIGDLSDLEGEWIQHYFDYLSRGTLADGARLEVRRSPIVARCEDCEAEFEVPREALGSAECNECGGSGLTLVSGREYRIDHLEVL